MKSIALGLIFTMLVTHQAWGDQDCYHEKDLVIEECMHTLKLHHPYVEPSNKCRSLVQSTDMDCVCRVLNTQDEARIDPRKIIRLPRECGMTLTVGGKCGSKCLIPVRPSPMGIGQ
ncbi:hypothetical protein BS78_04G009300, partial [Paspalum vaginatum]